MIEASEISSRLAGKADQVCAYLLPSGKRQGDEFVDDPGHGKIKVHMTGSKVGLWSHFGGDGSGDLLDLWAKVKCGGSLSQAYRDAMIWLGIEQPQLAEPARTKRTYTRPKPPKSAPAIRGTEVEQYLRGERGISSETIALFQIKEAAEYVPHNADGSPKLDEDGRPKRPWKGPWILFPSFVRKPDGGTELVNIKWLHVERDAKGKKQTIQESNAEPRLFGWQAVPPDARYVIICEGETDSLTYRDAGFYALSIPAGAGKGDKQQWIEHEWDNLAPMDTIYLSMDMDEEGQGTIGELVSRLGAHRCRIIRLPQKDANDCLIKAAFTPKDFQRVIEESTYMEPEELRSALAFADAVMERFYPSPGADSGIPLPWTDNVRLRRREVSMWTGINGHGKSGQVQQVMVYAGDLGYRSCLFSGEQAAADTLSIMVNQATGQAKPSPTLICRTMEWMDGRIWLYDVVGKVDRQKLLETFRYARRRYGIYLFVIDSFMRCGIAEDDYKGQADFINELVEMASVENCHLIVIAHPSKPQDESKPVGKLRVKGTGLLTDLAHNCFETWRNKGKEKKLQEVESDPDIGEPKKSDILNDLSTKPDALFICDKQRKTGWEGAVRLYFRADAKAWTANRSRNLPILHTAPVECADDVPY